MSVSPELSAQVNQILNDLIPEFNANFHNILIFVNVYFFLTIFMVVLLIVNIIFSCIMLRNLKSIDKRQKILESNIETI